MIGPFGRQLASLSSNDSKDAVLFWNSHHNPVWMTLGDLTTSALIPSARHLDWVHLCGIFCAKKYILECLKFCSKNATDMQRLCYALMLYDDLACG